MKQLMASEVCLSPPQNEMNKAGVTEIKRTEWTKRWTTEVTWRRREVVGSHFVRVWMGFLDGL